MNVKRIVTLVTAVAVSSALALLPAFVSEAFQLTGSGGVATNPWVPSGGLNNAWTGAWDGKVNSNRAVTNTLPSGTTVSVGISGNASVATSYSDDSGFFTLDDHGGWRANTYVAGTTYLTPAVAITNYCQSTTPVVEESFANNTNYCQNNTKKSNNATLTLTFSKPVTNPVINFAGVGGYDWRYWGTTGARTAENTMRLWTEFTLNSPPNATLTQLSTNPGEFAVDSTGKKYKPTGTGSTVTAYCITDNNSNTSAYSSDMGGNAGCGSFRINGTGTTFSFTLDYNSFGGVTGPASPTTDFQRLTNRTTSDTFIVSVALTDDYGSAPASYEASSTTYHTVGDLFMGAGVTPDALSALTPTRDSTGDDETNSSFKALPAGAPVSGAIGSNYTVTFPVTASAAGQTCGWVDWDRNGTYDAGEKQCATFAAGTSNQTLSWTIPAGAVAGPSWLRLRASYDTVGVQSPVGPVNSGEVEDFAVAVRAPMAVNDVSTGLFNQPQDQTIIGNDSSNTGTPIASSTLKLYNPANSTYGTSAVTVAGQGTYTISGNKIVFTPVNGYSGTATPVTYQIADSVGQTATATYTPTIVPPPTASNDTSSGPLDTAQDQTVLSNDSSGNGVALSASTIKLFNPANSTYGTSAVSVANQGTYTISGNKIVFTPVSGYVGTATPVTYQISDSLNQTATATYTPTIMTVVAWAAQQARAAGSLAITGAPNPSGSIFAALLIAMAGGSIYLASMATSRPRRRAGR